jgi:hypothetical protein
VSKNDDALARIRDLRAWMVSLRGAFREIVSLYEDGHITHAEELARLDPIMQEMSAIAAQMQRLTRLPRDEPERRASTATTT